MIDALRADDAVAAAGLSAGFGWPHRVADWAMLLRLGHGVAWREDGALAGTAVWFPLGPDHASIGLVQVAPGLQGRGIGRQMMRRVMAQAGPRSLVLHATVEGAPLYASLGFAVAGVVEQWQGVVTRADAPGLPVRRGTAADRAAIVRLDAAATGLQRAAVVDACMADAAVMVMGGAYAMRRAFGRGQLIGPMVAPDGATGAALLHALAEPGFLRLDVPAGTLAAEMTALGLRSVEPVQIMRTGTWPEPIGPARRFALASQALG
ncbi:GNAT family N-acetyltransferase [Acidisphaera sp. L21]|uniref:GNAT family N-acetyltransferase n=1 Tax=Acidisphaera sp. L21 TaxID=1641851 RepID=UPI00131D75E4|nr:GNAT family N-acetyltransferase [Acidisphaera sp. L21]